MKEKKQSKFKFFTEFFLTRLQTSDALVTGIYFFLLTAVMAKSLPAALLLTFLFSFFTIKFGKAQLAFYLGVFSLSFDQIFIPLSFSLKIHMLVFLVAAVSLAYASWREKKLPKMPPMILLLALAGMLFFGLTSIIPAVDKIVAARFWFSLFYAIAVFVLSTIFINGEKTVLRTVYFLLAGLAVSCLVAYEQYLAFYFGWPIIFNAVGIYNPGGFVRPESIFDHANFYANFLLVSVPILISYLYWKKWWTPGKVGVASIPLISLITTFSRAADIAIALYAVMSLFFNRGKDFLPWVKYLTAILLLSLLGYGAMLYLVGPNSVFQYGIGQAATEHNQEIASRAASILDPDNDVNIERVAIYHAAGKMLNDNWLFGVGLENFKLRYIVYKDPTALRDKVVVHNTYLQLWIEEGIFGAMAFAIFWALILVNSFKSALKVNRNSLYFLLLVGGIGAFLAVTFQNLTNSVLYYPHTWFLYGFLVALSGLALRKR